MRVLTLTRLWPNASQPHHGVFVEERMRRFASLPQASLEVIAPVPWFPRIPGPRRWTSYAAVPREETRHGIRVRHPRYVVVPKIGPRHQGPSLLMATASLARRMHAASAFDLVDAHFLWPDGFAATRIAKALGIPCVLSARGSDALTLPDRPGMRDAVARTLSGATMLIAVSRPIADRLVSLGADPSRVTVVPNGVDDGMFRFSEHARTETRRRLGIAPGERLVLSVGRLEPVKGHDVLLEALARLGRRDLKLVLVGEGARRSWLEQRASELGVPARLVGAVPHDELGEWYSAADLFCLPSRSEGHPNALIEALSCGTPSVATAVGSAPEVVTPDAGAVVPPDDPAALADAIASALALRRDRERVRAAVTGRSWEAVAREVEEVFREALLLHAHATSAPAVAREVS